MAGRDEFTSPAVAFEAKVRFLSFAMILWAVTLFEETADINVQLSEESEEETTPTCTLPISPRSQSE
jgi:hypothetical protein